MRLKIQKKSSLHYEKLKDVTDAVHLVYALLYITFFYKELETEKKNCLANI